MSFCTAINCMDGRTQSCVIDYLRERFDVAFVDAITEPGPDLILANQEPRALLNSIMERLRISVEKHKSVGIAVVGHHDCAGNPASREEQWGHIRASMAYLRQQGYGELPLIGLWVDARGCVEEVPCPEEGIPDPSP